MLNARLTQRAHDRYHEIVAAEQERFRAGELTHNPTLGEIVRTRSGGPRAGNRREGGAMTPHIPRPDASGRAVDSQRQPAGADCDSRAGQGAMSAKRGVASPQMDLFLPLLADIDLRDQMDMMERPFFSLSKSRRMTPINYPKP